MNTWLDQSPGPKPTPPGPIGPKLLAHLTLLSLVSRSSSRFLREQHHPVRSYRPFASQPPNKDIESMIGSPLSPRISFLALGRILFPSHLYLGITGAPLLLRIQLEDIGNVRRVAAEPCRPFWERWSEAQQDRRGEM